MNLVLNLNVLIVLAPLKVSLKKLKSGLLVRLSTLVVSLNPLMTF